MSIELQHATTPVALYFTCYGREHPQSVVLFHGLLASNSSLMTLAKNLAKYFRVYLPDLRNHGRSPHVRGMNYAQMAADVEDFLLSEEIEHPILIGHSMGGKLAMCCALRQPEYYPGVAVLDIAPVQYTHDYASVFAAMRAVDIEHINSRIQADECMNGYLEDTGLRQFLLKNLYRNRNGKFRWLPDLSEIHRCMDQILDFPAKHLQQYVRPTLFLAGAESGYIMEHHHQSIHHHFHNAVIETIPDAGHWLHVQQPQRTADRLLQFLQGITPHCIAK